MKNLLLVLFSTLIFSCSSSSDDNSTKSDFSIPTWLQGNWTQDVDKSTSNSFNFSSNDICVSILGSGGQCQQQTIDFARKGGISVNVIEVSTDKNYSAEIKYSNGQSVTYAFKKVSDNSIEYVGVIFKKQ
jgi:major membrane immunogen (membrane-anchored lipoprotein)